MRDTTANRPLIEPAPPRIRLNTHLKFVSMVGTELCWLAEIPRRRSRQRGRPESLVSKEPGAGSPKNAREAIASAGAPCCYLLSVQAQHFGQILARSSHTIVSWLPRFHCPGRDELTNEPNSYRAGRQNARKMSGSAVHVKPEEQLACRPSRAVPATGPHPLSRLARSRLFRRCA